MSTFQRSIRHLAVFLVLALFVTQAAADKPERPEKPGGGGKPPAETDTPVEVVYVEASKAIVIDGDMRDWFGLGCNLFPQYWAGKIWKNRENDGILAESCVVVWNGRVYVAGWATSGNVINDKAISTHVKFNGLEMVSNVDLVLEDDPDSLQPKFAYFDTGLNDEGWPIALAYEASFDYAFNPGENVEVILHVSSCPEYDCNGGSGQSARTLKSFYGVWFPPW
jgi:hypothetical protein